jgi:hypothetical protein
MDLMKREKGMGYLRDITPMKTYGIREIILMEKCMGYVSVIIPMES